MRGDETEMGVDSGIVIRPAADSDSAEVIRLIDACYAEYPGCVLDVETEETQLQAVASHFGEGGGGFWVAERDGEVVGSAGYLPSDAAVKLHHLYVAAPFRGRGLAQRLFDLVEQAARARGVAAIECWSDTRFERAHAFYERLGFRKGAMPRHLGDRSLSVEFFFRLPLR